MLVRTDAIYGKSSMSLSIKQNGVDLNPHIQCLVNGFENIISSDKLELEGLGCFLEVSDGYPKIVVHLYPCRFSRIVEIFVTGDGVYLKGTSGTYLLRGKTAKKSIELIKLEKEYKTLYVINPQVNPYAPYNEEMKKIKEKIDDLVKQ